MKKLTIFFYLMVMAFFLACEKDETIVVLKKDGKSPEVTMSPSELSPTINGETLQENFTIDWDEADYGTNTEVKYTIEIDAACNLFANPVIVGTTTNNYFDLTLDALNAKLLSSLKLAQHVPSELEIRVRSEIKGQFLKTSEPVSFTITPWSKWSKGLWLLGTDWNDASAPAVYSKTETTFDGYTYLSNDNTFRFADIRTCDKTVYGGADGVLSTAAGSPELSVGTSGYYRVKTDIENLTYEFTLIESFGIIGTATAGGWGSSTPLTYNAEDQTWEITTDLVSGALKFRANNQWTINYGPGDGSKLDGKLLFDDPGAISIQEPGSYSIIVDFSKKKSPDFTYSVVKRAADEVPAMLWLPGEYQGWSPGTAPTIKAINSSSFEGFVYISAPTGYKFTSAPDWDHINYGDAGTPGVLTTDGLANGLGLSQAGYYKFNVNVNTLTYSATLINSMGMVGPATLGGSGDGWNQSVAMTYSQANDVWTATIDLSPGALKFRANNEWTINYGPADGNALTGTLIFDDPGAINITEAGNYTVTIDMSRSEAPYKYTYKIVKN
jgi:starch-binding outer membrane protein SusE/F